MELLSPATQYAGGIAVILAIAFLLYQPTGLVKWLQKKNYQYEVTFSLYMMTPTEKFVFNSILFLTFSMFSLAVVLYLPDHIVMMARRGYYYFAGEAAMSDASWQAAADAIGDTASKASEAVRGLAETAYGAAVHTAAAAQEAATQAAEP